METGLFACFLALAAGQDMRRKQVDVWVYLLFGGLAAVSGAAGYWLLGETYGCLEHAAALLPGALLLGARAVTRGAVGGGDGCFFLVSGLLLGFWENVMLLCYGILFCGIFSLVYVVWGKLRGRGNVGKETVPFLPFVALPGIWLVVQRLADMGL